MLLTTLGTAMIAASAYGIHRNMPNTHLKIIMQRYLRANDLDLIKVRDIRRDGNTFKMDLLLPYNITAADVQEHVMGMEQVTSSHIRFSYSGGPTCTLEFGYSDFRDRMPYVHKKYDPLTIPLYTPFGTRFIDFRDESCCHLLIGGTTRMGKTTLIRLMITLLIHGTNGKVCIKAIDNKVNDLYMFRNVPQVEVGETEDEAVTMLTDVLQEMENRKRLLKQYGDCMDAKEFREKHPEHPMDPMFVIIDEYGRFADHQPLQELVIRLVEMAGYVDIHMVVASQRPDAQSVLKPRIKANLLTRICFTTVDDKNSIVVLDVPDAAKLNRIKGRAVLLDGFPEVVQVPYLSTDMTRKLMQPFEKIVKDDEHVNSEGRPADTDAEPLQGFKPQPIGEDHIPEPKKRNNNRKSRVKKA